MEQNLAYIATEPPEKRKLAAVFVEFGVTCAYMRWYVGQDADNSWSQRLSDVDPQDRTEEWVKSHGLGMDFIVDLEILDMLHADKPGWIDEFLLGVARNQPLKDDQLYVVLDAMRVGDHRYRAAIEFQERLTPEQRREIMVSY